MNKKHKLNIVKKIKNLYKKIKDIICKILDRWPL